MRSTCSRPAIKAPGITILPEFSALIYLPPHPQTPPTPSLQNGRGFGRTAATHARTHARTHAHVHTLPFPLWLIKLKTWPSCEWRTPRRRMSKWTSEQLNEWHAEDVDENEDSQKGPVHRQAPPTRPSSWNLQPPPASLSLPTAFDWQPN